MLSGIVLAGGESRRMKGKCKPLLPLGHKSFIEVICNSIWKAGVRELIVVLGARADEIRSKISFAREKVVVNHDYLQGQISSLKAGVRTLSPDSEGVLFQLIDHPLVQEETYRALVKEWRRDKDKIIIPSYKGRKGHPTILPASLHSCLLERNLPLGVKTLFTEYADRLKCVEVIDEGVCIDIDTFSDYRRYVGE
jgi:CTP:molybdopterin cytidylyltransferase MocA